MPPNPSRRPPDHYANLGVPPDADQRRLDREYRRARHWFRQSERDWNGAMEAHAVLSDPVRRRAHDREVSQYMANRSQSRRNYGGGSSSSSERSESPRPGSPAASQSGHWSAARRGPPFQSDRSPSPEFPGGPAPHDSGRSHSPTSSRSPSPISASGLAAEQRRRAQSPDHRPSALNSSQRSAPAVSPEDQPVPDSRGGRSSASRRSPSSLSHPPPSTSPRAQQGLARNPRPELLPNRHRTQFESSSSATSDDATRRSQVQGSERSALHPPESPHRSISGRSGGYSTAGRHAESASSEDTLPRQRHESNQRLTRSSRSPSSARSPHFQSPVAHQSPSPPRGRESSPTAHRDASSPVHRDSSPDAHQNPPHSAHQQSNQEELERHHDGSELGQAESDRRNIEHERLLEAQHQADAQWRAQRAAAYIPAFPSIFHDTPVVHELHLSVESPRSLARTQSGASSIMPRGPPSDGSRASQQGTPREPPSTTRVVVDRSRAARETTRQATVSPHGSGSVTSPSREVAPEPQPNPRPVARVSHGPLRITYPTTEGQRNTQAPRANEIQRTTGARRSTEPITRPAVENRNEPRASAPSSSETQRTTPSSTRSAAEAGNEPRATTSPSSEASRRFESAPRATRVSSQDAARQLRHFPARRPPLRPIPEAEPATRAITRSASLPTRRSESPFPIKRFRISDRPIPMERADAPPRPPASARFRPDSEASRRIERPWSQEAFSRAVRQGRADRLGLPRSQSRGGSRDMAQGGSSGSADRSHAQGRSRDDGHLRPGAQSVQEERRQPFPRPDQPTLQPARAERQPYPSPDRPPQQVSQEQRQSSFSEPPASRRSASSAASRPPLPPRAPSVPVPADEMSQILRDREQSSARESWWRRIRARSRSRERSGERTRNAEPRSGPGWPLSAEPNLLIGSDVLESRISRTDRPPSHDPLERHSPVFGSGILDSQVSRPDQPPSHDPLLDTHANNPFFATSSDFSDSGDSGSEHPMLRDPLMGPRASREGSPRGDEYRGLHRVPPF